jgi:hypothetical protein
MHKVNAIIISGVTVLSVCVILSEFAVVQVVQAQEPRGNVLCTYLNITNLSTASKPSGTIDVLGIISNNNSTLTYDDVGVVGELYDSNDKLLGIESGSAEFATLGPDGRSPFNIKTYVSNQTLDHFTVSCRSSDGRLSTELP